MSKLIRVPKGTKGALKIIITPKIKEIKTINPKSYTREEMKRIA